MKPLKLNMDSRPGEQPDGTYPYGKNGIQSDLLEASFNEPGFRKLLAVLPYSFIGKIEGDEKIVCFSTDNLNSAIGYFNPVTELYEPIVNDNPSSLVNWPADGSRLGFTLDHFITGEGQRNYKREFVVLFTDKDKFPKYLNCDTPSITQLDDTRLFPFYKAPTIQLSETVGGSLKAGAYYVAVTMERKDGTTTPFSEVSDPLTIAPGAFVSIGDRALLITISNADPSYDFIRVAVISKVDGKTSAVQLLDAATISSSVVEVIYTGDNLSEDLDPSEILTPPAVYDRVDVIGQLNDAVYIGGLHKEADFNDLQPWANMVQLQWVSELIDATSPPEEHRLGQKRSLMHQEVYAFYIEYHKTRGGYTKAYHTPGLPPSIQDLAPSAESLAGGETTAVATYKVEDTIPSFDLPARSGKFGTWQNSVETYPNTADFNSTFLGGRDLRNQKVLHHRAPSLRWCKANLYSSEAEYGKTKLDLLGIKATGIIIPAKYQGQIDGYRILYAKRTPSNMTVYAQGTLLHGAVAVPENSVPTGNANIFTTGGNWGADVWHQDKGDYNDDWELRQLRQDTMRFHAFDLLLSKPSIAPNFISAQYKIRRNKLQSEGFIEDGYNTVAHDMPTVHLVDYTLGATPTAIGAGRQLRKIKQGFYLPQGVSASHFNNDRHEPCFAGVLAGANWPLAYGLMGYTLRGKDYTVPERTSDFEEAYVVNLLALKEDVYSSFYSQTLVSAGAYRQLNDSTTFWGGDSFACDYTFHTYGRHDQIDTEGDGIKGKKVIRRFVCESASNIHLRYEIPGNTYSVWYPRTAVAKNNPDQCYITNFDRSKDPNQFGYTRDLNALSDFLSSTIFSPFLEEQVDFPYRIHRGGKLSRQSKPRSWRTFLALDYYECQKNLGRMINLEGLDDTLIIHFENGLLRTRDKAKLEAGLLSITLGTGDIFQFEPQPARDAKFGYAGTQHQLACLKSPVGYFFPDARTGEIFLLGSQLENLSQGVEAFLQKYMKVTARNPYLGNGIVTAWDQKHKRLMLTVKNQQATVTPKKFSDTNTFYASLQIGDIIDYNGRLIQYKGINNPALSGLNCDPDPLPPDELRWVADATECEQDKPVTSVPFAVPGAFIGLSSPGKLFYDTVQSRMYVMDHDLSSGNLYYVNPTTGTKNLVGGLATTAYSFAVDPVLRKLYASSLIGLHVLDIDSGVITLVNYGSSTAQSRTGLWLAGPYLLMRDGVTGTLTIYDRSTQNVVHTLIAATDIPFGTTYFVDTYELLDVDNTVWVLPNARTGGTIAVYSSDLSTMIGTLSLPGNAPVNGWGSGKYYTTGFYDKVRGRVYIYDVGSSSLHIVDPATRSVLKTITFFKPSGTESIFLNFILDPLNADLFLQYTARQVTTGTIIDPRVYQINRSTGSFQHIYMATQIEGQLVAEGTTGYMWVAIPGKRSWEGGSWATDGQIKRYAHSASSSSSNTGQLLVIDLRLKNITQNILTASVKPNIPGDPDYIAPTQNLVVCPVTPSTVCPVVTAGVSSDGTGITYQFSLPLSVITNPNLDHIHVVLKQGSTVIETHIVTDFSTNFFTYTYVGLAPGVTYTIDVLYFNDANVAIQTCVAVATVLFNLITWQGSTPSCVLSGGTNTGYKAFTNRIRLTNGVADGYTEANTNDGTGIGPYIAPVIDHTVCPLPGGSTGICFHINVSADDGGYHHCQCVATNSGSPYSLPGLTIISWAWRYTGGSWTVAGDFTFGPGLSASNVIDIPTGAGDPIETMITAFSPDHDGTNIYQEC